MNTLCDVIFQWRSEGPELWIGVLVTGVLLGMGWLLYRIPKGRVIGAVLFGIWTAYVVFVFTAFKLWPDEVMISPEEIHGRHDLSTFSMNSADIQSIRSSRSPKGGSGLHVFLKSSNRGVGIPIIHGSAKEPYKSALRRLCPDAKLDW